MSTSLNRVNEALTPRHAPAPGRQLVKTDTPALKRLTYYGAHRKVPKVHYQRALWLVPLAWYIIAMLVIYVVTG